MKPHQFNLVMQAIDRIENQISTIYKDYEEVKGVAEHAESMA